MSIIYRPVNADQYVSGNYGFLRIKQALASAGDIFESVQGAHSFCLGPDSDVSLATIAYFDQFSQPTYSAQATPAATNMNTLTISPQRAWVNPIPAVNKEGQYAPAGTPGRVLIWPTELYDSTFKPFGFSDANESLVFEPPVIDILQAFAPTSAITPQRVDKTYYYERVPPPPGGSGQSSFIAVPFYGRRYASIMLSNNADFVGAEGVTFTVYGVNFRIKETVPGVSRSSSSVTLIGSATMTNLLVGGQSLSLVVRSDYDSRQAEVPPFTVRTNAGLFDYLMVELEMTGATEPFNATARIVVSDVAG